MKKYILSIDSGTTSTRAIIFNKFGKVISSASKEFSQYYPKSGWVEHNASEIWSATAGVIHEAIALAGGAENIATIGITNQRETTVVWDKKTGEPICPAIVWQCRRTAQFCDELANDNKTEFFASKTGLKIDAYFSATKLKWILDNVPNARSRAEADELLFGTIDSFLLYKLTGGKVHATDPSNAARTMLFNIHEGIWDKEILSFLNIPEGMLPTVLPSSGYFGETEETIIGKRIPICGIAGDQQAALFGQCCFSEGQMKNTYGTGGFLLMNTGCQPAYSKSGLLTTIAWKIGDTTTYALEGSVFISGAAIKWLRDEMKLLDSAEQSEVLGNKVGFDGVYFVPAFVGLGTPYWDPDARGAIFGLTRGTTDAHFARATLEAMAYQTRDIAEAMQNDTGNKITELYLDGGASRNDLLLKLTADITGINCIRPANIESTALGAAFLAGLGAGIYTNLEEIAEIREIDKVFSSEISEEDREKLYAGWKTAVEACRKFKI